MVAQVCVAPSPMQLVSWAAGMPSKQCGWRCWVLTLALLCCRVSVRPWPPVKTPCMAGASWLCSCCRTHQSGVVVVGAAGHAAPAELCAKAFKLSQRQWGFLPFMAVHWQGGARESTASLPQGVVMLGKVRQSYVAAAHALSAEAF
jgi:hypothetical protein